MSDVVLIEGVCIRRDAEGRFRLNDLHEAAGGERRHDTREFLDRESTKGLIRELESEMTGKPVNMERGRYGGTFVCKELVYHYASWVSAAFNLKVYRVFDAVAAQRQAPPVNLMDPRQLQTLLLQQIELSLGKDAQIAEKNAQITELSPKALVYDEAFGEAQSDPEKDGGPDTIADFVRKFDELQANDGKRALTEAGYLYRTDKGHRVYAKYRGTYFTEKYERCKKTRRKFHDIRLLPPGVEVLTKLIYDGKLRRKVNQ